jgi:hypothetical protein
MSTIIPATGDDVPRVKPEDITATIVGVDYHRFPGTTMIICAITLQNGFMVIGQSRPANDALFDEKTGRDLAYADAREKIWSYLGYALRDRLHREAQAD